MLEITPELVLNAARVGMRVPPDACEFDADDYPHFYIYIKVQGGRNYASLHNAQVIRKISNLKIRSVSLGDCLTLGLRLPY